MNRTILSTVLASLLTLSACGGSAEEDEAKAAISGYLMEQQDDKQMITLEKDEADCISGDMVDGIGVEKLKEYGFLNDDGTVNKDAKSPEMSEEDSEVMVDAMFECTDVMDTMRKELAGAMGSATPEMQECFEDALSEEMVRSVLVATFSGDEAKAQQELMGPLGECITGGTDVPDSNNN
ncbi:MAG TPA: hypothetical protein VFR87_03080 [Nocardioidaceae bacterium]|nr:hypothetical protein [Nocardioidaceae bacterium]